MTGGWDIAGSLADWSTVVVAGVAARFAWQAGRAAIATNEAQQKTLDLQREQLEVARQENRRKQASGVNFWTDIAELDNGENYATLSILNLSSAPIYDVIIAFRHRKYEYIPVQNSVLPPIDHQAERFTHQFEVRQADLIGDSSVYVYFRDSDGAKWVRNEEGLLWEATEKVINIGEFIDEMERQERLKDGFRR